MSPEEPSSAPDLMGGICGGEHTFRISKGLFLFPSEVTHLLQRAPAAAVAIRETEAQPNMHSQFIVGHQHLYKPGVALSWGDSSC